MLPVDFAGAASRTDATCNLCTRNNFCVVSSWPCMEFIMPKQICKSNPHAHSHSHNVYARVYALECKYCPCESTFPLALYAASSRSSVQEMFIAFIVYCYQLILQLLNRGILKRSNLNLTRTLWNTNSKLCYLLVYKMFLPLYLLSFCITFWQWEKKESKIRCCKYLSTILRLEAIVGY